MVLWCVCGMCLLVYECVCSFHCSQVEMVPCLLTVPGVEYILSEKLCQDPLESLFGKQRAAGGRSDNPTVQQFCKNIVECCLAWQLWSKVKSRWRYWLVWTFAKEGKHFSVQILETANMRTNSLFGGCCVQICRQNFGQNRSVSRMQASLQQAMPGIHMQGVKSDTPLSPLTYITCTDHLVISFTIDKSTTLC